MLSAHPVHVVLLSKDLKASRAFYADKLGLPIEDETDSAITYTSGGGVFVVTASTVGTKDEQTQAAWEVADLRAELDALATKGVTPEEYNDGEITTVDGIADRGSVWVAWITDPDGNVLGIEQKK